MGILSRKFGVIEIAPGVTATLEEEVLDWMDPYFCGNPKAGEIKPGDEDLVCTSRETTRGILNPILQDRFVPHSEAGYFSYVLSEAAGDDHYLIATEIGQKNLDEGMARTDKLLFSNDHGTMTKEHLFAVTKGANTPHLFSKKLPTQDAVNHHLEKTKENLEFFLKVLEEEKTRLYEESLSYTNFISAENLFGLSAWFTHDGTPFSHNELDGTRRAIRVVRDILEGLEIFRKQFEKGEIDESHPAVKKFLESPAGEYAHLGSHLGFGLRAGDEKDEGIRFAQFISKMTGLIAEANATRTAEIIAESYKEEHKDVKDLIKIDSPYGNTLFRLLDGELTGFANSFISLDSLAMAATGTLAGKVLLSTAKGTQYGFRIAKALGRARPFLPGQLSFTTSSARWGMKAATAAGNVGFEFAKMRTYQFIGFKVGGREGMEFVGNAYMFAGGFLNAVEGGLLTKVADDVLANRTSQVVDDVLRQADDELVQTAYAAAPYAGQRTLRLPRGADPEILWQKMQKGKADILAGGREIVARMEAILERLRVLVASSGGVLKAKLVLTASRLLHGADKVQALRQVEKMFEDAQKKLEAAVEQAKACATQSTTKIRKATTPARGTPRLTEGFLRDATQGKVNLADGVLGKMEAFVRGDASRQEALLSAVKKIASGDMTKFRTTHGSGGTFLTLREKDFQIFFNKLEGGLFEIVEFTTR